MAVQWRHAKRYCLPHCLHCFLSAATAPSLLWTSHGRCCSGSDEKAQQQQRCVAALARFDSGAGQRSTRAAVPGSSAERQC